ncbi:hypothetical protein [Tautonia rosea]|uniref:hypothetical protein n=1 Tax=Tautonia rosea TaxID=2728037 RepID=UPI001472A28C|nr:hypothetical protein [Tautonia rosea]
MRRVCPWLVPLRRPDNANVLQTTHGNRLRTVFAWSSHAEGQDFAPPNINL